jgi:plasmid stabilization system protein ParE
MTYTVKFTYQANKNIHDITSYIKNNLYAPFTAEQFLRGIYARIAALETDASVHAISTYRDVLIFGDKSRQINYKGFVIIYTIHDDIVLVHRIIHGSIIKE